MTESKFSVNIGARDLSKLAEYRHSGVLHIYAGKTLFRRSKWKSRYIVICKGKTVPWNFVFYLDHLAKAAEEIYSMLEFESVKQYNDEAENIIGFTIKFEKPLVPLIFSCDTKDSQMVWIEHIRCAIEEAHKFSADSAYASGGSTISAESNRISKPYNTIDECSIQEDTDTQQYNAQQEISSVNKVENPSTETTHSDDDTEASVVTACDDPEKHSYENMTVTNQTFRGKKIGRKQRRPVKEGIETEGGKRDTDETAVKTLESYPAQNREEIANADQLSAHTERKKSTGTAEESVKRKTTKKRKAKSVKRTEEVEPCYENIEFDERKHQMENLKMHVPSELYNSFGHSHTDVNQTYQDDQQRDGLTVINRDQNHDNVISELTRKINKDLLNRSIQSDASDTRETTPPTTTVSSCHSFSYLSVQAGQGSLLTDTKSYLSVREGANKSTPLHSTSTELQDNNFSPHTRSNSLASSMEGEMIGQSTCEKATRRRHNRSKTDLKIAASAEEACRPPVLSRSQSVQQVYPEHRRGSPQTPVSVNERSVQSSGAIAEKVVTPKVGKTDSVSVDSRVETSITALSISPTGSKPTGGQRDEPGHFLIPESETKQDDEQIYENTDLVDNIRCDTAGTDKGPDISQKSVSRQSSISSSSSFSSGGSRSSRDSDLSLRTYESPDEVDEPHYQNVKVFERRNYFYPERRNVKRIMSSASPGTFLVCPGERTQEEICVMTPVGIRYFRVHIREGMYSLFKDRSKPAFPSMDNLLFSYSINNLPSREYELNLERGYKSEIGDKQTDAEDKTSD